jgi:hypothetical protein
VAWPSLARKGHAFELVGLGVVTRRQFLAGDRGGPQTGSPDRQDVALYAELLAGSDSAPGVNANPLFEATAARMARHDGRDIQEWARHPSHALALPPRLIITKSALF